MLTLNLHKGFSSPYRKFVLHELRDAIREVSADIVFLQEVLGDHREHSTRYERWPKNAQYEFLADTIWDSYAMTQGERRGLLHTVLAVAAPRPCVRSQSPSE
jgi:endonuclease/exonuclease/phosphatase family metal-dependent hydrolase